MKYLKELWEKLMVLLESMDSGMTPAPEGFQPGIVPDELDSFEGWK